MCAARARRAEAESAAGTGIGGGGAGSAWRGSRVAFPIGVLSLNPRRPRVAIVPSPSLEVEMRVGVKHGSYPRGGIAMWAERQELRERGPGPVPRRRDRRVFKAVAPGPRFTRSLTAEAPRAP